jgi:lysophospholipase L1-like esterase
MKRLLRWLGRCVIGAVVALVLAVPLTNLTIVSFGRSPRLDPAFVAWAPEMDLALFRDEGAYRLHPRAMWMPRPGAYLDGDVLNEYGYRGPVAGRKAPDRVRIAVVGDSQAFGHSLPDNESWPRRVEQVARLQGRDVEVVNAAVTGHSCLQSEVRFEEIVAPLEPDVVLIAFTAVNDAAVAPHGRTDRERIALLSDRELAFQNSVRGLTIVRSLIKHLWPNRKPSWTSAKPRFRVDIADFEAAIGRIAQRTREWGGEPIVVIPWRKAETAKESRFMLFDQAMRRAATAHGVRVFDIPEVRRQALAVGLVIDDEVAMDGPFRDPIHYSRKGHDIVGGAVCVLLGKAGLLGREP